MDLSEAQARDWLMFGYGAATTLIAPNICRR